MFKMVRYQVTFEFIKGTYLEDSLMCIYIYCVYVYAPKQCEGKW